MGKQLSWQALPEAASYRLEFSANTDFTESRVVTVTDNNYELTELEKNQYVRVTAIDAAGRRGESSESLQVRIQNTQGIWATIGGILLLILL